MPKVDEFEQRLNEQQSKVFNAIQKDLEAMKISMYKHDGNPKTIDELYEEVKKRW